MKLIGKMQEGTLFLTEGHSDDDQGKLFEFTTDGLDRAVMSMKKGEIALVTIGPNYAFASLWSHL